MTFFTVDFSVFGSALNRLDLNFDGKLFALHAAACNPLTMILRNSVGFSFRLSMYFDTSR